jgi:chromosomal replication initiator protein
MIQSNIRELEGALIRVIAYSSMNNVEISLQLAVETLKTIIPSSDLDITKDIPVSLIQRVVAEYYGIRVEDLLSTKKDQRISRPRHIAMYITRELTNATLPKIGEEYGGRHHSTVIHACDEIRDNLNDPIINLDIRNVITRIKGYSI